MSVILFGEAEARDWIVQTLTPTAAQWQKLECFADMLAEANETQNLVSASTLPHIWVRHIADSAQLLLHDQREGSGLWIDLGSGAGLPGLVIAILSDRPLWLVESRGLRCQFLRESVDRLGLQAQVTIQAALLERIQTAPAATISARAFAPLPKLLDLSARFSTTSTRWLLPKGRNAVKELAQLPPAWQKMFHVEHSLTDADSGIIVGTGQVRGGRNSR
jgi:16S rRNA (guanine527-N7)-methyltransferase